MKLHWSSRSPFVRKVMVAAHELGLVDRITCVRTPVAMDKPNLALLADNPLSKLPTMVLDDGTALYDSDVICEHLDLLDGRNRLFPADPPRRIATQRRHALGNGFLDLSLIRRNERDRPPERQSPAHLAAYAAKTAAVLAALDKEAESLAATPLDIGHIAIGCALSYLDFRFATEPWRPDHRNIARWHAGFEVRPSMQFTLPIDG